MVGSGTRVAEDNLASLLTHLEWEIILNNIIFISGNTMRKAEQVMIKNIFYMTITVLEVEAWGGPWAYPRSALSALED